MYNEMVQQQSVLLNGSKQQILFDLSLLKLNIFPSYFMDVSNQLIDQLFSNQYFQSSFQSFILKYQPSIYEERSCQNSVQIQDVIDEIGQVLGTNFKTLIEKECNNLYESNRLIWEEIQALKTGLQASSKVKTESSTAQRDTGSKLETSLFFDGDDQYEMRQIRRNMDQLQDEVQNKVLVNSFELEQQDRTYIDIEIQQKINASIQGNINRIQLSLEEKFEKYSIKLQQRIQQLRKTIASVVQAMNEQQFLKNDNNTTNTQQNKSFLSTNAFAKKQTKPNHNLTQNMTTKQIPQPLAHNQKLQQVKNPQRQKQQLNSHSNSNSNKTMQSLNKSINLGRTKIKSLFGFKSGSIKQKQQVQ